MDFVKREDPSVINEENYKIYLENLQKSHQIEAMEYQHSPISMEQLHQAMQSSLGSSIVHNLQLPLSPRQMSFVLKSNHIARNFTEIPAHLSRSLDLELGHSLANELSQNLRSDDFTQNMTLRGLSTDIDMQTNLAQSLQNLQHIDDLRINDVSQNLRVELPHDLSHEMDLSHHLNRQNIEQAALNEEQRTSMVIQCVPDAQLLDHNLRLDSNLVQKLQQSIGQRLDPAIGHRLDTNIVRLDPRLEPTLAEHNLPQRLEQGVHGMMGQAAGPRLDPIDGEHVLPMQFHIKSEQEDEAYFYDNIDNMGQNMENVAVINGHLPQEHSQPQPAPLQPDTQIYSVYPPHSNIPALNPIDLYSRTQNYPQNFARDNPQNLVMHRYEYEEKKRQDGAEKNLKLEQPKENLKPSDQNKIYYTDYPPTKDSENHSRLTEELSMIIKGEYVCYKCNEILPSKRGLKQHAKSCIESETEKTGKFSCSQCAYRCQSPAILKIHERTHSGEKPFSCNMCDYKSGQKNNVAKHILVHMKEKPFRCQYCDYRCAQKNNLVVHERTHTGVKPFACPYCDYRTVQKPNLVKHMYLHTDQKPFSCDMCNYRCVQKTNLTKHKQRHLNEKESKIVVKDQKPYRPRQKSVKCPLCVYRCVQKNSMDKHMKYKHAGVEYKGEGFERFDEIQNLSVRKEDVASTIDTIDTIDKQEIIDEPEAEMAVTS